MNLDYEGNLMEDLLMRNLKYKFLTYNEHWALVHILNTLENFELYIPDQEE